LDIEFGLSISGFENCAATWSPIKAIKCFREISGATAANGFRNYTAKKYAFASRIPRHTVYALKNPLKNFPKKFP